MTDETEVRKCPHCEKPLRSNNNRGVCKACWDLGKRPAGTASADDETSVLDRLGFGQGSDEHPAEKRVKPPPKGARRPSAPELPTPSWQAQFRQLATALGLEPDSMLEAYCRNWVETTRARALNTMPFSVANGAAAAAEEPAPIAADSSVSA